ncbi:HAD family phosphatase [Schaalia sp. 19OD2882]|uniref:HAD family hydrolase n=1 Tax=Schaalia sp. 19OD2882 TaxID=2794089 RepID=UPI001C1EA879|nr:HAD family hydrolase [Schaalia sp. 19OD2882]QWW19498.1 HAD family phosphatase [Schaalia sp. 19OD2882]
MRPTPRSEVPHGTTFLTPPPSGERALPFEEQVARARAALPEGFPTDLSEVLVAVDVDGTLITAAGASARVRSAYHDLLDAGGHVVVSTGRGRWAARPVLGDLGERRGFSACSNGALLVEWDLEAPEGGRILRSHVFSPRRAIMMVQRVVPEALFGVEVPEGYLVNALFPEGELLEHHRVVPVEELWARPTTKLVVRVPGMDTGRFEQLLGQSGLGGDHEVFVGWTSWADVCAKGCTKASALEELCGILGVPHGGTVALGDGSNDVDMITWARVGVAMGGAAQWIKDRADLVTGAVENDGSAAVMRAILEHSRA